MLLGLLFGGGIWGYWLVSASLPQLSGEASLQGLVGEVEVSRDRNGVASISGRTRHDVARATGFIHAQERFFQMDLLRRKAAGELAGLLGPGLFDVDVAHRRHDFRALSKKVLNASEQSGIIEAYTSGVNRGLKSLKKKPFEYFMLQEDPRPWLAEDSVLVVYAMYLELQGKGYKQDALLGELRKHLSAEMLLFLSPQGTSWDAPIDKSRFIQSIAPLPSETISPGPVVKSVLTERLGGASQVGSNSWAVSGALTPHGGALLAGDMHLGLNIPNIWYRLQLDWLVDDGTKMVAGVSLPGLPFVVAGSNGHIAWSFTNSYGDWLDLVDLVIDPQDSRRYQVAEGWLEFEEKEALIEVHGEATRKVVYPWTKWGPVLIDNESQTKQVLRWTAHKAAATNLNLAKLEQAKTLEQGVVVAQQSGGPVQNIFLVDKSGGLAWTLMGRLPQRAENLDTRFPMTAALADSTWQGWLPVQAYPQIINPSNDRLWNGNGRMVGGEMLAKLGDGGYALGARQMQIRDGLLEKDSFSETDFLALQLDDKADFLTPWHVFLTSVLASEEEVNTAEREKFKALLVQWEGEASTASVSYRLVRAFRLFLAQRVFEMLLKSTLSERTDLNYLNFSKYEGPLWQLLEAQPAQLLSKEYGSWQSLYLSVVDEVIMYFDERDIPLSQASWGARNSLQLQHPLAQAIPGLDYFLNMPSAPLPGDNYMPRVQAVSFGASQRMVVSPGREHLGYMHMPGGQSGHPLSPFYRAGHDDWVDGNPSPFLATEAIYTLHLRPE